MHARRYILRMVSLFHCPTRSPCGTAEDQNTRVLFLFMARGYPVVVMHLNGLNVIQFHGRRAPLRHGPNAHGMMEADSNIKWMCYDTFHLHAGHALSFDSFHLGDISTMKPFHSFVDVALFAK